MHDGPAAESVGLTVYFTDVDAGVTKSAIEDWGKLPAENRHDGRTHWGTEIRQISQYSSAWITYDHENDRMALTQNAFLNTGQRGTIRSMAFSECLLSDIHLLMVAKEERDVLQFWAIQDTYIQYLQADVFIFAAVVKWVPSVTLARKAKGIIAIIAPNETLSFYLVELNKDIRKISVRPCWSYDNPDDAFTCIDTSRIKGTTSSRVVCATASGHVILLSFDIPSQSSIGPEPIIPEFIVRVALHCGPIGCISWMAGDTGIWFVVGNNQGKLILCDRRQLHQPEIASIDTITRPFTAIKWTSQPETILGSQMDAFILSTTFMGTSRFNPLKTIYDIRSRVKKTSSNGVLEAWRQILFPSYRSEKAVKIFEVPAIGCCATGNLACFTFDAGCAVTGSVSDFDIKSYDSARVYLWSPLQDDPVFKTASSSTIAERDAVEIARPKLTPNKIIETINVGIEQTRNESIQAALKNGVHITACNHSSLERVVRWFGVIQEPEMNVSAMRQADALQLGATAATFDDSDKAYIAYGGGLGLIHLMMALKVLMVAEKNSVAESITKALSQNYKSYKEGGVALFEFHGAFLNKEAYFKVTATNGHLLNTDFPSAYNDWNKVDATELFDVNVQKKPADPKSRILKVLQKEAIGCDALVLWLDCDREGENICFEVIDQCAPQMNRRNPPLSHHSGPQSLNNIYRVKFSSLVPGDLRSAFNSRLTAPNINLSESVDARQEIDLKLGVSFTRLLTQYFQNKYGDLDSSLISYGPCQMPTLWFCVRRWAELENFQSQTYFNLFISIGPKGQLPIDLKWAGGPIFEKNIADAFLETFQLSSNVRVTKIKTSPRSQTRPLPLNTVEMLKKASDTCGLSPHRAMQVSEHLYLMGLITYPRTESTAYPQAFGIREIVTMLSKDGNSIAQSLLETNAVTKPRSGVDVGDHPPISPCGLPSGPLDTDAQRVYNLVVDAFLEGVSGDAQYMDYTISVELVTDTPNMKGHQFNKTVSELIKPGFLRVSRREFSSGETTSSQTLKTFKEGTIVSIDRAFTSTLQTKPPSLLTESKLLALMDKNGIGTDASMATHIKNILDRNYVGLTGHGRQLRPTKLGIALCRGIESIDAELVKPVVRALVEKQCDYIAQGKTSKPNVVHHAISEFKLKFQYFLQKISVIDNLFELSFTALEQMGSPFSRCGQCKKYLKRICKRPERLVCKSCSLVLRLPAQCNIRTIGDAVCPLDAFEIFLVTERNRRAYTICPLCYNFSPYTGMSNIRSIDFTTEDMNYSQYWLGISKCFREDCDGCLYIQNFSGGVDKAFLCSKCDFFIGFDSSKVKQLKKIIPAKYCDDCGWSLIKVTNMDGSIIRGCIGCSEQLESLLLEKNALKKRSHHGNRRKKFNRRKYIDPKMTFDQF